MIDPERGSVGGVVLAAGASSRMGTPKPLLQLEGRTYLDHVVESLASAGAAPLRVVLGAAAGRIEPRIPAAATPVRCSDWAAGMLVSLQTGVASLLDEDPAVDGVLVALCDMPRIRAGTVRALRDAFLVRLPPVAVPVHRGRRGHPVVFGREGREALLQARRESTPRHVVGGFGPRVLEVEVDDPWVLRDADTPAEHRAMQAGRRPEAIDG